METTSLCLMTAAGTSLIAFGVAGLLREVKGRTTTGATCDPLAGYRELKASLHAARSECDRLWEVSCAAFDGMWAGHPKKNRLDLEKEWKEAWSKWKSAETTVKNLQSQLFHARQSFLPD